MRIPRFGLPIAIVAGLLTACSAAPPHEAIETDVDKAVESESPNSPEQWGTQSDTGAVQVGWIETFNDSALTKLVTEAQANNRDLTAAAASVDRAWALARQAGAALSPDISLAATGGRSGSADSSRPTTTNLSLGLQVSWEADVWGRLRSGQRGAVASAQAVEADYRSAQYSLAAPASPVKR